jgi:hypothetical protein
MCRPFGTRLINLILPGTAVPGLQAVSSLRDCFVAVSTEGCVCRKSEHAIQQAIFHRRVSSASTLRCSS